MLVISDSFIMQNFNIKEVEVSKKIEKIAILGAKSIFLQYFF